MGTTRTTPFNTSSVNPGSVTTPGNGSTSTNTASTGVPNTDFPTTAAGRAPPNSEALRRKKNKSKGNKSFQNNNMNNNNNKKNQLPVKPIGQTIKDSKTDEQKKHKTIPSKRSSKNKNKQKPKDLKVFVDLKFNGIGEQIKANTTEMTKLFSTTIKSDENNFQKTWNTRIQERRKRIKKLTEKYRRQLAKRKRKRKIRRKTLNQKLLN
jgi:hypothetical protein